jgi:hypothetical protein
MTAIYAYAHGPIAFVAGDSVRTDRLGPTRSVCKVHHWSDSVVLAQAGEARELSELLQAVLPLMGWLEPTADGFIQAFNDCRGGFWNRALQLYEEKQAGEVPAGTVLVAEAAADHRHARVFKLDFESGEVTDSVDRFDADGAEAEQFRTDAQRHLEALQANGQDRGVPLDIWAARCVQDAATAYRPHIGFPADVLIARPNLANERILVHRRITGVDLPGLDVFQVP